MSAKAGSSPKVNVPLGTPQDQFASPVVSKNSSSIKKKALFAVGVGSAIVAVGVGIAHAVNSSQASSSSSNGSNVSSTSSDSTFVGLVSQTGCLDESREWFVDMKQEEYIAGCSGAWGIAGTVTSVDSTARTRAPIQPTRNGDCLANPASCNAADVCAAGWHMCRDLAEVQELSVSRGCGSDPDRNSVQGFFTTAQSGEGYYRCDATGYNDLFGCGDIGAQVGAGCPLGFGFLSTNNRCTALGSPWECKIAPNDDVDNRVEALLVTKPTVEKGGVLCCKDVNTPTCTVSEDFSYYVLSGLDRFGYLSLGEECVDFTGSQYMIPMRPYAQLGLEVPLWLHDQDTCEEGGLPYYVLVCDPIDGEYQSQEEYPYNFENGNYKK